MPPALRMRGALTFVCLGAALSRKPGHGPAFWALVSDFYMSMLLKITLWVHHIYTKSPRWGQKSMPAKCGMRESHLPAPRAGAGRTAGELQPAGCAVLNDPATRAHPGAARGRRGRERLWRGRPARGRSPAVAPRAGHRAATTPGAAERCERRVVRLVPHDPAAELDGLARLRSRARAHAAGSSARRTARGRAGRRCAHVGAVASQRSARPERALASRFRSGILATAQLHRARLGIGRHDVAVAQASRRVPTRTASH